MKLPLIIERIYARFAAAVQDARVILLHPHSRYRSLFAARLLDDSTWNAFYYALGPDDFRLESFATGLMHEIAVKNPLFGYHLNQLDPESWNDPAQLIPPFAADLAELGDIPFLIVLDEYDRSDAADDIQTFIEQLISVLPSNGKLVINSRTMPRLPWMAMIARRHALILNDDQLVQENFYGVPNETGDPLEVRALGPGFVTFNERTIDSWEGHLPRLLFFFALDRPVITRSEICQAFWTELDLDQAVNVFHVTKRRLHKALDTDVLIHEAGAYRINPTLDLYYDAAQFVTLLLQGRDLNQPNRIDAYQQAVDLYRGPFLQGHSDSWVLERRLSYQVGYLEALDAIANHWLVQERPEYALAVYQRAVTEDSMREDIHRKILRLYLQMGRRSEAAAHLQRVIDEADRAKRLLDSETERLREEILALI